VPSRPGREFYVHAWCLATEADPARREALSGTAKALSSPDRLRRIADGFEKGRCANEQGDEKQMRLNNQRDEGLNSVNRDVSPPFVA
jgi:hypothetical protein